MTLGYVILSHRGNADKETRLKMRSHFHNVLCLSKAKGMDVNMKLLQDVGMNIAKVLDNLDGMTIMIVGKGD